MVRIGIHLMDFDSLQAREGYFSFFYLIVHIARILTIIVVVVTII